jgi:hypothetical protein
MSDVVIRCPNCGTTQDTLGTCDACHEAETRYFCSNHQPGRWLDGPACSACGARYGVDRQTSRPPRSPRAEPLERRQPRPLPPDESEPIPVEVWTGPVRTPGVPDFVEVDGPGIDPRGAWPAGPTFPAGIKIVSAGGCVRRIIVLFVILLALAALAMFGILGVGARLLFGGDAASIVQGEWDQQGERRAFARDTLHGEVATHSARQIATDGEAKPDAIMRAGERVLDLNERLEDGSSAVGRNPNACVANVHLEVRIADFARYENATTLGSELDRVGQ